jgi:hypothetical protein
MEYGKVEIHNTVIPTRDYELGLGLEYKLRERAGAFRIKLKSLQQRLVVRLQ